MPGEPLGRRWKIATVVVGALGLALGLTFGGCDSDSCIRHSDCPGELICGPAGSCIVPPPPDAAVDVEDGGNGDAADASDATDDASVVDDASIDDDAFMDDDALVEDDALVDDDAFVDPGA
jgi:hypothetical protein